MDIPSYHLNFVNEEYDENGILKKFSIKYPDNFNFAYDIIDKYGEMEPDRRALMWVDLQGNEKLLTYGDLSKLSNRAANMFRGWGIKKGDKVMLVLKRNYQYWVRDNRTDEDWRYSDPCYPYAHNKGFPLSLPGGRRIRA